MGDRAVRGRMVASVLLQQSSAGDWGSHACSQTSTCTARANMRVEVAKQHRCSYGRECSPLLYPTCFALLIVAAARLTLQVFKLEADLRM